jgi:hypothetical protein
MNKKILLLSGFLAGATLLAGLAVIRFGPMSQEASAAMPEDQCYKMASNKAKALANMNGEFQGSSSTTNPCTGESDTVSTYYEMKGGVTHMRSVYGNGDVVGYLGLTRFTVCQDGRAKVTQRIYGPASSWGRSRAWGFWWNFPFDDDTSPYSYLPDKEICNTL